MSRSDRDNTTPEGVRPSGDSSAQGRGRLMTSETLMFFRKLREAVMRGPRFSDDSTDLIEQARAERTAEL